MPFQWLFPPALLDQCALSGSRASVALYHSPFPSSVQKRNVHYYSSTHCQSVKSQVDTKIYFTIVFYFRKIKTQNKYVSATFISSFLLLATTVTICPNLFSNTSYKRSDILKSHFLSAFALNT